MDDMMAKKLINLVSNMKEEDLKLNLEKVSKVLGNTNSDELMKKLKDNNIIK